MSNFLRVLMCDAPERNTCVFPPTHPLGENRCCFTQNLLPLLRIGNHFSRSRPPSLHTSTPNPRRHIRFKRQEIWLVNIEPLSVTFEPSMSSHMCKWYQLDAHSLVTSYYPQLSSQQEIAASWLTLN